jgi:hypothetical protein
MNHKRKKFTFLRLEPISSVAAIYLAIFLCSDKAKGAEGKGCVQAYGELGAEKDSSVGTETAADDLLKIEQAIAGAHDSIKSAFEDLKSIRPDFGRLVDNPAVIQRLRLPVLFSQWENTDINGASAFQTFESKFVKQFPEYAGKFSYKIYDVFRKFCYTNQFHDRISGNFYDFAKKFISENPQATPETTWEAYRELNGVQKTYRVRLFHSLDEAKTSKLADIQSNLGKNGGSSLDARKQIFSLGLPEAITHHLQLRTLGNSPFVSVGNNIEFDKWAAQIALDKPENAGKKMFVFPLTVWKADLIDVNDKNEQLVFGKIPASQIGEDIQENNERVDFHDIQEAEHELNGLH